jgi:uncharacterized membrane protein YphA (DoxX/SURF4 family)
MTNKPTYYLLWILQVLASVILLQTLYFKFTPAPESVYIFSRLGVEPLGRVGSGIVELIAGILLLIPRAAWLGALIAVGVMAGAILSHLTILGIEIMGDHGQLFIYALIVFTSCLVVLLLRRKEIPFINKYF